MSNDSYVSGVGGITHEIAEKIIFQKHETADVDYKEKFRDDDIGSWMELAKDVYGMANNGGGYIVIGVEDGTFKPKGLEESFHIDSQVWTSKLSKWVNESIEISYYEYPKKIDNENKKFPILQIHGSLSKFIIPKTDGSYTTEHGQKKIAFTRGVVYTRDNTSTVAASGQEYVKLFWAMINRTATKTGANEIPIGVITALNNKTTPDSIQETLWFNLFPVQEIPDYIYSATTNYRDPLEIYQRINEEMKSSGREKYHIPVFFLHERQIFSFSPFDEYNPLTYCVTLLHKPIKSWDWLRDEKKHNHLVMLLNFSLKDLCKRRNFTYDRKKDRYYAKYYGGKIPEVYWKPYKKFSTRKLIHQKINKENELIYCEHFAAKMRFIILGGFVFLNIEPYRVLTEDGINPLDQKRNVRISTRNNSWYHNNNYLYDLKLILHILAGNKNEIHMGKNSSQIIVSLQALDSTVDFGIINDQHAGGDFLDSLQSEPLAYDIISDDEEPFESNPLTQTSLEESS